MDAGKTAEACAKFEESQSIEPAAGTLLNLADCYARVGQAARAWATYQLAAKAAASRNRQDWVTTANRRAGWLDAKLGILTVAVSDVAAGVPGLRVERDGETLEHETWGTQLHLDPGAHTIRASAPGRKPWTADVELLAGKEVTLRVPLLEENANRSGALASGDEAAGSSSGAKTSRTLGFVVGATGLAAAGVGIFTGVRALGLRSDAKQHCESYPSRCSPDASDPNGSAKTFATVSTITIIGGAVLIGAGLVLILTAPKKPPTAAATALQVFGPSGLRGTF
jgi:hypothetical protein